MKQHVIEMLLSGIFALMIWDTVQIYELREKVAVISLSVNHIDEGERTLRELVEETAATVNANKRDLMLLEERTRRRYPAQSHLN